MIVKVIPVIPPELRPLKMTVEDLQHLTQLIYTEEYYKNNRLKRLMEINAPDIILKTKKNVIRISRCFI